LCRLFRLAEHGDLVLGQKCGRLITTGCADPKEKARLVDLASAGLSRLPADFGKLIIDETEKWAKVVQFTTFSAAAQLRVSSDGVAISTTEIGTERAMRAAILPGRAGAIRVTSE